MEGVVVFGAADLELPYHTTTVVHVNSIAITSTGAHCRQ